jgi:hypothetical protein
VEIGWKASYILLSAENHSTNFIIGKKTSLAINMRMVDSRAQNLASSPAADSEPGPSSAPVTPSPAGQTYTTKDKTQKDPAPAHDDSDSSLSSLPGDIGSESGDLPMRPYADWDTPMKHKDAVKVRRPKRKSADNAEEATDDMTAPQSKRAKVDKSNPPTKAPAAKGARGGSARGGSARGRGSRGGSSRGRGGANTRKMTQKPSLSAEKVMDDNGDNE